MKSVHFRFVSVVVLLLASLPAFAHCDTMAGPVVVAARRALDKGDVSQLLKWVQPADEAEVREVFNKTLSVRKLSPEARELADRFFFETVVRLHRRGENQPFTGLKDAPIEPAIAAADKALESGDIDALTRGVRPEIAEGIRQRFRRVRQASAQADVNLSYGREYVRAYVDLMHYVEAVQPESKHGHTESSTPHQQSDDRLTMSKVEVAQFTANKASLKKNEKAKLVLAFRSQPGDAHIRWRLACSGLEITGWSAPQLLRVAERSERGAMVAIDAAEYVVTSMPVQADVKRLETSIENKPQCSVSLEDHPESTGQNTIVFEPR